MERLRQQLRFVLEVDRLKGILRRSYVLEGERLENSAEHSWHVALMALLLVEHAAQPVNVLRVVTMMLVHDIVEIDAGDTFCYDTAGHEDKAKREQLAAERLFGLLPPDQRQFFRSAWEEFEARETADARFAAALDRLMPLMHNVEADGKTWKEHGVLLDDVLERNQHMREGAPALWDYAREMLKKAVADGLLQP